MPTVRPDSSRSFSWRLARKSSDSSPRPSKACSAYAFLTRELVIICQSVGFDPFVGFFHQPRFGRPALALDLMEGFRPLIADSAVLSAINTRMVGSGDFIRVGPAVSLTASGRKGFIRAYEQRMDTLVTHPLFGYRVNYQRVLEIQGRALPSHHHHRAIAKILGTSGVSARNRISRPFTG